ncbi:uncharacterized protein LOC127852949 isoform X1 [Dreissena polymorpha]|uniref:uncharacterized protein LOC127852949 isoform X1 n=1 Tax=Dreissena polymorpha TaxID=45954 RepID=UPI00226522A5|nr:uncharacterized protein LOC127852949 isoform X1 [Dreissena polymorpha]
MRIRPSDVLFSQDSINNYFDDKSDYGGVLIGETLDDICEGRTSIDEIPPIIVVDYDGEWVTVDNRRLWVFRELERLGACRHIDVDVGFFIPDAKMTSTNGGASVHVRRNPGGYWHKRPDGAYKRMNGNWDTCYSDDSDDCIQTTRIYSGSLESYPGSSVPPSYNDTSKNTYASAVARKVYYNSPPSFVTTNSYEQQSNRDTIIQESCVTSAKTGSQYLLETNTSTTREENNYQSSYKSSNVRFTASAIQTDSSERKKNDSWCNIL